MRSLRLTADFMRRLSTLAWLFLALGSTALAASPLLRSRPTALTPEPERKPARTTAPAATESRAASAVGGSRKAQSSRKGRGAVAAVKSATELERLWGTWLAAMAVQHTEYAGQLIIGSGEIGRIDEDPAFSAVASDRNRKVAAIPAAAALRAHGLPEAGQYASGSGPQSAPVRVEDLMRQGEKIAFRTDTATSDTQGLMTRVRRTPGVASGGHVTLDAMAADVLISHLRTLPGYPAGPRAYAVTRTEALRSRITRGDAALEREYAAVRDSWLILSTQAADLHQKYLKLREALVARDEE